MASGVRLNRSGRAMRWGTHYVDADNNVVFARSGACKLYCHAELPPSAFEPPAASRRRCGPCDAPCKDCAACAVVTVAIRGQCSVPGVLSRIRAQAAQLQALDLSALRPPLGAAGAAALSDVIPSMQRLSALALDDLQLRCRGLDVLCCGLMSLTRLQVLSCSQNFVESAGASKLAAVLTYLTGLQTLDLGGNSISAAGAESLGRVLSSLTGLQTLDLSGNSISAAGAAFIAHGYSCFKSFVHLGSTCSLLPQFVAVLGLKSVFQSLLPKLSSVAGQLFYITCHLPTKFRFIKFAC